MAGRVLLISINRCDEPYPVFPLGLGHIDHALQRAGYDTRWVDLHANGHALDQQIAAFQPDYVGISIRNIDDVVIRTRETFFGPLSTVCPQVRQLTRAPIVLGGSGFSIFPRELLQVAGADFGICGEGEEAMVQLLQTLEGGGDLNTVPGLVHRRGRDLIVNQRSKATASFPAASRPSAVATHYLQRSGMLNVQTQRGCGHRCCYCTYPLIEGRSWRRRDPVEVAEEMAQMQAAGARYVFIVDSVFNSSRSHAAAVCEALLQRGVKLQWGCFLRPQGLTADLMELMQRAGLSHIEFGSDSFSDVVLREYDKRLTFEDIRISNELAHRHKVEACHFLVCGGPGETRQTMEETHQNSLKLEGSIVLALVGMRVYPGTPLFERAQREGVFSADTDYLSPQYYVAPELGEEQAFALLRGFSERSRNWIVGDPSPAYLKMAERLRSRGVVGPLWSYFATMQRIGFR